MRRDDILSNVEILSVQAGLRRAGLIEHPPDMLSPLTEYLSRAGVAYKSITQDRMHLKRLGLGLRPSGDRRPNFMLLYIGKDMADAEALYELDIRDKSVEMGTLLGYPPCCVDYHQLMKADPATHPSWKSYFKYAPHNPCSRFCAPTIAMEATLKKLQEQYASSAGLESAV